MFVLYYSLRHVDITKTKKVNGLCSLLCNTCFSEICLYGSAFLEFLGFLDVEYKINETLNNSNINCIG